MTSTESHSFSPQSDEFAQLVQEGGAYIQQIRDEMAQAVVGQKHLIDGLLIGLLTNSHVLLEGVPGLAKTTTVKALASCVEAQFQRIQFTPDLLPADVVGTLIYNPKTTEYTTKFGPIFTNILLADEINRCPPKVQAALLEAMQEQQVTLGEQTYALPSPFLVLATENPVEQDGTYPLPEAQVDRFMLKVYVDYPTAEEERQILDYIADGQGKQALTPMLNIDQIAEMRNMVQQIYLADNLKDYIVQIVLATRSPETYDKSLAGLVRYGGSPRATINITRASRAQAFLQGRSYVTPDDIKDVCPPILGHRVLTTYEAEAEEVTSETIISRLLELVPVP
ncbi:MAG: MoxR family ATPase [Verrucomicrobiota bacterium]